MGGVYNTFQNNGIMLDEKRRCDVFAVDYNTKIEKTNTFITAEWAWINVQVPDNYTQQYGNKQLGGFIDIVQTILKRKIAGWNNASINIACRLEYVDWNVGKFKENGDNIGENIWSFLPAISFRPSSQTVFRLNYRHQRQQDILCNEPAKTGGFSFGVSTYF